jgi:hypothetical protein
MISQSSTTTPPSDSINQLGDSKERQPSVPESDNDYVSAADIGLATILNAVNAAVEVTDSCVINFDPSAPGNNPTPPPSGYSSKAVPKSAEPCGESPLNSTASKSNQASGASRPHDIPDTTRPRPNPQMAIGKMFERFHQSPNGDFKPTAYNPFEVKHRRRTSKDQFKALETIFMSNCKPSANVRKELAQELGMSARAVQVWFQNRRAKLKNLVRLGKVTDPVIIALLNGATMSRAEDQSQGSGDDLSDPEDEPYMEESLEDLQTAETSMPPKRKALLKQDTLMHQTAHSITIPDHEVMPNGQTVPSHSRSRSYSCPDIQKSPQLPFRPLQDALFNDLATTAAVSAAMAFNLQQQQSIQTLPKPSAIQPRPVQNYSADMAYQCAQPNTLSFAGLTGYHRPRSCSTASGLPPSYFTPAPMMYMPRSLDSISEDMASAHGFIAYGNGGSEAYGNSGANGSNEVYGNGHALDFECFMSAPYNPQLNTGLVHHPTGNDLAGGSSSSTPSMVPLHSNLGSPLLLLTSDHNQQSHHLSNQHQSTSGYDPIELAFLPQPTNDILLSTLIDEAHFLN